MEGGVALKWDAPTDDVDAVDGYQVLRRKPGVDDAGVFHVIKDDTGNAETSYTDATAREAGAAYTYRVKARRGEDLSGWSNYVRVDLPDEEEPTPTPEPTPEPEATEVTATQDATGDDPPAPPTDLEADAEHDSVTLTWAESTDDTVTHYAVLHRNRDTDEAGVFQVIQADAGPEVSYTDSTVAAESSYEYRVKAVSPTGVSRWSGYADTPAAPPPTATPGPTPEPTAEPEPDPASLAPSGLSAVATHDSGVFLTWNAPQEDAGTVTGYEVLRAQGEAELTTLAEDTGSADTSYTDATATGLGETYAYRVRALRGEVKSQASNRTEAVIPEFLAIFTHVEGGPPVAGPDDTTLREDGDPLVPEPATAANAADWTAALTVGGLARLFGYAYDQEYPDETVGSLDPLTFTVSEVEHIVYEVSHSRSGSPGSGPPIVTFYTIPGLTADFVLKLGDSQFQSNAADKQVIPSNFGTKYIWTNPGLAWARQDVVAVSLVANNSATGVTISGMAYVGEALTADISAIADPNGIPEGVTYTYQWFSSDDGSTYTEITGETGSTYTLPRSDIGKTIRVEVSFTDTDSFNETVTSGASAAVILFNFTATGQPTITGTPEVGLTLTADASGIADANGIPTDAYSYRWLSSDDGATYTAIREEAGLTYMLRQSDHGKTIKFEVSFTDRHDFNEAVLSRATRPVALDYTKYASFDLHSDNDNPLSIWGDGTTLWVGDTKDSHIYAYHVRENPATTAIEYGTRGSSKDIAGINDESFVVTGDDRYIWIGERTVAVGASSAYMRAYDRSDRSRVTSKDFQWRGGSATPIGIIYHSVSDGNHIWVSNRAAKVPAIGLNGSIDDSRSITFSQAIHGGLHLEGDTIWGANSGANGKAEARRLSDGSRWSARDVSLGSDNIGRRGLWSNGVTMFHLDNSNDKILTFPQRDNATGLAISGTSAVTGAVDVDTSVVTVGVTADTSGISDPNGLPDPVPDGFYRLQWQQDVGNGWEDIAGATGRTYPAPDVSVETAVEVRVSASFTDNAGYAEQIYSDSVTLTITKNFDLEEELLTVNCWLEPERCIGVGPKGLQGKVLETGIRLRWRPPPAPWDEKHSEETVLRYEVARATGSGRFAQIACLEASSLSTAGTGAQQQYQGKFEHLDTDVVDDVGYRYLVRAHYDGTDCASQKYTSWTGSKYQQHRIVPSRFEPQDLQGSARWVGDKGEVTLTWTPPQYGSSTVTDYVVIRAQGIYYYDWRPGYPAFSPNDPDEALVDSGFPLMYQSEVAGGYAEQGSQIGTVAIADCGTSSCSFTNSDVPTQGRAYHYGVRAWRDANDDDVVDSGELSGYSNVVSFWFDREPGTSTSYQ